MHVPPQRLFWQRELAREHSELIGNNSLEWRSWELVSLMVC